MAGSEFNGKVVKELGVYALFGIAFLYAAYFNTNTAENCTGSWSCLLALLHDRAYWVRTVISNIAACIIYLLCAVIAAFWHPREVKSTGVRPPTMSWLRLDADLNWSLVGLLTGAPMTQLFHHANDVYGPASGMLMYKNPMEFGLAWALLQIPIYLLLWDFTFYCLHRWVLHSPLLYEYCHSGHHAFRPPTAWSGIAVGPIDVIFEGLLPYFVPLFLGIPFHEYTVNAVNAVLTFHACMLHSSCKSKYDNINGVMGWLMISPIGHNMHHQYGLKNACNFAPIFKIWDRLLGTLNEAEPFWWNSDKEALKDKHELSLKARFARAVSLATA